MKLSEKVSYLKGLMDGLEIDNSTKEGKVLIQMADILKEMAADVEDIEDEVNEVVELVDILNDDLSELESDYYDFDDEDEDEEDDDEDYDDEDDDENYYEVICPTCGDTVCLDEDMIKEGSINCPNCKELLEFDFEDDSDEE